jgi:hypothetical protein
MAEALNDLLEKRKVNRMRYTKVEKSVLRHHDVATQMVNDEAPPKDLEIQVKTCTMAMEQLHKIQGEIQEIQYNIDFHPGNETRLQDMDDAAKRVEEEKEDDFSDRYLSTSAKIHQLEKVLSDQTQPGSETSNGSFNQEHFTEGLKEAFKSLNTGITADQMSQIIETMTQRKRQITIPKFRGDADMFDQWRELVDAEINKPGYSEVEKVHYTLSVLEGEPSKVVAALKDPTYEDIINALENKYGDVLAMVQKAVIDIAEVPGATNPTVKELDHLYTKLNAAWHYLLKKTNNDPNLRACSWILTALVRPKIPKSLLMKWDSEVIKAEKSNPTQKSCLPIPLDRLLENLQEALQIARRTDTGKRQEPEKTKDRRQDRVKEAEKPKATGHALHMSEKKPPKSSEHLTCCFCDGSHLSYTCPKVKEMSVSDRLAKVKEKRVCFNCFKRGHYTEACRSPSCRKCNRKHHTLLHYEKTYQNDNQNREPEPKAKAAEAPPEESPAPKKDHVVSSVGLVKAVLGPKQVLMQSGIAKVESKVATSQARVLFDSGSGVNFVSKSLAHQLGLKGKKITGEFTLAGGSILKMKTEEVKFHLSSALPNWRGETFEIIAYIIDQPSSELSCVELDLSEMYHIRDLQLADTYPRKSSEVDILLGIEDTSNVLMDETVRGPRGLPIAQRSHIGWILSGTYPVQTENKDLAHPVNRASFTISEPTEIATKHWEIEHLGILPDEKKQLTKLEEYALEQHQNLTVMKNGRYETGLIRHPDWQTYQLRSNKKMAEHRLKGLERRLNNDPCLAKQYEEEIKDLIEKGRAEKIHEENDPNSANNQNVVWYLPHHPVIRTDKTTTKVRIVFDGSAKGPENISLNDTLLPGPPTQPDILGILLRFRKHQVTIVADIEKMFLQVKLNQRDQDLQRFLWRNLDMTKIPDVYRLTGVTFGLKCSPFSCIRTVTDHVNTQKKDYPKAAEELSQNIFVDDVLSGADSVEEAAQLMLDMRDMMAKGGFPLKKFQSNQRNALKSLDQMDLDPNHTLTFSDVSATTKTLGVKYHPLEDVLMFSFCDKMDHNGEETRRTLLQQLHRIYDPMGLLAPFTVRAKQLFQQAWLTRGDWDDPLPEDLSQEWEDWKEDVTLLDEIKVKRCLIPPEFKNPKFSLHAFGDASEAAYGACVYLRVEDVDHPQSYTTILCSKTRVTPLGRKRSIPELELMAALIAARLVRYVEKEMNLTIDTIHCWTDSKVTLAWISQPAYKWQVFVGNRVSEIHQLVKPDQWKHVPGKENPADLCSRGCTASTLVKSEIWWNGPEFLRQDERHWPPQDIKCDESVADAARKKDKPKPIHVLAVTNPQRTDACDQYTKRFETYHKFISVFTKVRQWLKNYRQRTKDLDGTPGSDPVILDDYKEEELWWIRWVQGKAFGAEIEVIKQGEQLPPGNKLNQLDPVWDNDMKVLRVGGRLQASLLPDESKNPIILPIHEPLTEKLIMHYHTSHLHTGVAQTLANIRTKYWLIHGRQEVRRILHTCKKCRTLKPMAQKMAPLPEVRVSHSSPFTFVGTDFAGPLYTRGEKNTTQKAYIVIFSCMTTRAVHLELTEDMTAVEFLKALERMTSRRGKCATIYSDNAKTFKKASTVLRQLYHKTENRKKIEDEFHQKGIEWKFITERAPWHGGFYERMVRSIKNPLKKVLGNAMLSFQELVTILTNVEAQINSRPLTDISADKNDPTPLTPGHFLIGRNMMIVPNIPKVIQNTTLGKRWYYRQRLEKQFWTRWYKEYIAELNQFKKWTSVNANARVGDIVLIVEDNVKKQYWLLGRIEEVHLGRDNLVRSVTLRTKKGLIRRPIQRLCLLEAADES